MNAKKTIEKEKTKNLVGKSKIKKWENSYRVPIAYFGVIELERDSGLHSSGTLPDDSVQYWGQMTKVLEGIPIRVLVSLRGGIDRIEIENRTGRFDAESEEEEDLYYGNRFGGTIAQYYVTVSYADESVDNYYGSPKTIVSSSRDYGGPGSPTYMSVEDAIEGITQFSEELYPKVAEYINQEKVASTKKSKPIKKDLNELLRAYDNLSSEEKAKLQAGLDELCTGFSVRDLLAGEYTPDEKHSDDDYYASTKKSKPKSFNEMVKQQRNTYKNKKVL